MKAVSDIIQYMVSQAGWLHIIYCAILALLFMQVWKLRLVVFDAVKTVRRYVLKLSWWNAVYLAGWTALIWALSIPLADLLQYYEQRYWAPVYVNQYRFSGDQSLIEMYEAQTAKFVTPTQLDTVRWWTAHTAATIGCTPLEIYETAYFESGCDPFNLKNPIAAGWIQFTCFFIDSQSTAI